MSFTCLSVEQKSEVKNHSLLNLIKPTSFGVQCMLVFHHEQLKYPGIIYQVEFALLLWQFSARMQNTL